MRFLAINRVWFLARCLALAGMFLQAWIFTGHVVSLGAASMGGTAVVDGVAHAVGHDHGGKQETPAQKKARGCPICAGLAALDFAAPLKEAALISPSQTTAHFVSSIEVFLLDRKPQRFFNRGPPIAA